LGLAYHHRIQAGSHAEQVPHRITLAVFVEMLVDGAGFDLEVLADEATEISRAVGRARQKLHPVAGGDDQRLLDAGMPGQALGGFG